MILNSSNIASIHKIKYAIFFSLLILVTRSKAQNVFVIPDPNLKAKLQKDYSWVLNNGDLDIDKAANYTGELRLENSNIKDASGISYFINIYTLNLSGNQLSTIQDISGLTNLHNLYLMDNQITTLPDLSGLINLEDFQVYKNQLTVIPDLSSLISLKYFYCGNNKLTTLPDLSSLNKLEILVVGNNPMPILQDLSGLKSLKQLHVNHMGIDTIIGLSNLSKLEVLYAQGNKIKDLSGLEAITELDTLCVYENDLKDLPNLSNNLHLKKIYIENNYLTFEDIIPVNQHPARAEFLHFSYAPQKDFPITQYFSFKDNTSLFYDTHIDEHSDVTYQWYKDGEPDQSNKSRILTFDPLAVENSGTYHLEVRHPSLPSLVLKSTILQLEVKPCIEMSFKNMNVTSETCREGINIEFEGVTYAGGVAPYAFGIKSLIKSDTTFTDQLSFNNLEPGLYKLVIRDNFNCKGSVPFTLQKPKDCQAVFTPDGDGFMDSYFIDIPGKIKILDSGRNLIKELVSPTVWDGTKSDGTMADAGYYAIVVNETKVINITLIR